jgi:hypothetical protein
MAPEREFHSIPGLTGGIDSYVNNPSLHQIVKMEAFREPSITEKFRLRHSRLEFQDISSQ